VTLAALIALLAPAAGSGPTAAPRGRPSAPAAPSSEKDVAQRAAVLLGQMTVEEKVGQTHQLFYFSQSMKPEMLEGDLAAGQIGSLLFVTDPAVVNRLQKAAVERSRLKIPLLFGFDVIHGFTTIFPLPIAMAASWDPSMVEKVQTVAAREASAVGIRWTFAPMVDIARDPRWGRIVEGAGEDQWLGSAMARAQVRGFQGDDVSRPDRLLACVKHFAAYGAADGGRDYDASNVPESLLRNVYLAPFRAAVDAGAGSLMSAYQDLDDVPATGNRFLLTDVLRREWGFRGFVVSDAEAVGNLVTHGFARDKRDAALRAFTAGVNMEMSIPQSAVSSAYHDNLARLLQEGRITTTQLDEAVRPILEAKIRLGLFEHPYVDEARVGEVLGAPEHRQLARVAAQRSAVLLRNEGGLLPLAKDDAKVTSIAVLGPLADSARDIRGSWALADDPKTAVSVLQGIRAKVPARVRVESTPGSEIHRVYPSFFDAFTGVKPPEPWTDEQRRAELAKATELARRSDVVVMALGELESMSGEAASQSTLSLPGNQLELLQAVVATGRPVVLVLVNGRPLDLSWASAHVPAILEAWHPGAEGGNAIADLLFGDATPGGKLPVTWPRSEGQIPIYYAHNLTQQPETASGFKSRYWDVASSPLFPFRYGLSYTTFAAANLRVSRAEMPVGETLEVTADVRNTGARAGDEVAQLYIHQRAGSASRPVRELKGFERLSLAPGETRTVRFDIGPAELTYWSAAERRWVQEAAEFDVWVGSDSSASLHASFTVASARPAAGTGSAAAPRRD